MLTPPITAPLGQPHDAAGPQARRPSMRALQAALIACTLTLVALLFAGLAAPDRAAASAPRTTAAPTAPAAATVVATTPAAATPPSSGASASAGATTDDAVDTDPPVDQGLTPVAPTDSVSYAARLVVPVVVRVKPSGRARKVTSLKPFGSWNGGPVVLSIAQVKMVGKVRWLRVLLPIRPNGISGWLPQSSVEVMKLRFRILISRSKHTLTVFKDGAKVKSTKVVVGAPGTPTPAGHFAVLEVVRQPRGEDIGPWALHLTAHSDVLDNFGGGPGRVAIHGRAGDLLADPLGSSRSHGCIRLSNTFVTYLQRVAKEGTPVEIV